ncbi:MAG: dipeptidase, partial [Candidatus Promineifilaceae bacterium]
SKRDMIREELFEFLSIPSISTQPKHKEDVINAASWLAAHMEAAGLEHVQLFESEGHPLIYGDWLHAGDAAPTVLIYGHYDVQPVEPLALWHSKPFTPELRGDFVYARGASDDKGQLYIHIKAVEAFLTADGRLPVNVKFILEGEEESGGESLSRFIPQHRELLAADVALISDTAMMSPGQPAIVYGLRGIVYTFIDVTSAGRDLHSGSYGGAIDNPLNALSHIIANLKDQDGHVLIPGFYDKVAPLSDAEKEAMAAVPFDEEAWLAETGALELWGESQYTVRERLGARPTLDVHGIIGGYTGAGRKTVLPSHAHAKISMRLVPDQNAEEIARHYVDFVQQLAPSTVNVDVTICSTNMPSVSDLETPAMRAAAMALQEVFGREPVYIREGGSIPVVAEFQEYLNLETVMMGFGLPDDRIHAPNERFYLPNFYRGIESVITFFDKYAELFS